MERARQEPADRKNEEREFGEYFEGLANDAHFLPLDDNSEWDFLPVHDSRKGGKVPTHVESLP